jgi:DNA-3-methyladenine glycosylase I
MDKQHKRCWNTTKPIQTKYHDEEWGVPVHDDRQHFEYIVLDGFQAGLSWWTILDKREAFRKAFDNFEPKKVAKYTSVDFDRLMNTSEIVRNKSKITSAITNAQQFLKIQKEFGSFDKFIWQFVDGKTINHKFTNLAELPAQTEESNAMSQELKKRGFKFVGPTICYAYMQAAGLVNDHLFNCFRHNQISKKK